MSGQPVSVGSGSGTALTECPSWNARIAGATEVSQ